MSGFAWREGTCSKPFLDLLIESDRLLLTPTTVEHAGDIYREFTAGITKYMIPRPAERIEETLEFIAASRNRMAAGGNLQFSILHLVDGEFLGCCGLHGEGQERAPELGIWLKGSAHGRGYGREAIAALVGWAFRSLDLDHIVYPVDRRNGASRAIPESMGASLVGEKKEKGMSGNQLDLLLYRIERVIPVSD